MKALKLVGMVALATGAIAGCDGGSGSGGDLSSGALEATADVPNDVSLSWPAMYDYLLAALGTEPDQKEPARLPGETGPTSDVVEAEAKP